VRGNQDVSDAYYSSSDVIGTYLKCGELRPDLVILNLNFSDADTYSFDNIDGLTRALLTCGEHLGPLLWLCICMLSLDV